jgi:hypothetical protein
MLAPLPTQVLNEFRNALTHLSRAAACVDSSSGQRELDDARRHLERGTRDAYKILVFFKHDSIMKLTGVVEARSRAFPVTLYKKLRFVRQERQDILIAEHVSPAGSLEYSSITDRYKKLVETLTELEYAIKEDYDINTLEFLFWGMPGRLRNTVLGIFLVVFMVFGSFVEERYSCYLVSYIDLIPNSLSLGSILPERCQNTMPPRN